MDLEKDSDKLEFQEGGVKGYAYHPILSQAYNVYPSENPNKNSIIFNDEPSDEIPENNNKSKLAYIAMFLLVCFFIYAGIGIFNYYNN